MKTQDIFSRASSKQLNESLYKVFGKRINFESFDLDKLHDARNKLRTQVSQVRDQSGFNETIENEALTQAQWMLDAINAEISERAENIINTIEEAPADVYEMEWQFTGDDGEMGDGTITYAVVNGQVDPRSLRGYCQGDGNNKLDDDWCTEMVQPGGQDHEEALSYAQEDYAEQSAGNESVQEGNSEYQRMFDDWMNSEYAPYKDMAGDDNAIMQKAAEYLAGQVPAHELSDIAEILTGMYYGEHEGVAEGDRTMSRAAKGYEKYGKQGMQALAKAGRDGASEKKLDTIRDRHDKYDESIEQTGDDMRNLREGEIQQASAIVTAKTMVDRVGRWIEELSGMENDTLLTLGDSIRDEMGQEQAKAFISAVAPAIQSALETLKTTRDTLSSGVRNLADGEQPEDMLGAEAPDMGGEDELGAVEPDAMNPDEAPADEFGAADAATGGMETAGREQRESIDRGSRLMKVLAG